MSALPFLMALVFIAPLGAQPSTPTAASIDGGYVSAGVGIVDIGEQAGLSLPLGITLASSRHRLLTNISLLDIGLFEGSQRNPRYVRRSFGGRGACYDSVSGFLVSNFYCSGGTDVRLSATAELNYLLVERLFVGQHPARIAGGLGFRLFNPRTLYLSGSLYIAGSANLAGGFKLALGRDYVYFGVIWGLHMHRIARAVQSHRATKETSGHERRKSS